MAMGTLGGDLSFKRAEASADARTRHRARYLAVRVRQPQWRWRIAYARLCSSPSSGRARVA